MENFDKNIDEHIARHLAGEATPEEDAALQKWAATSSENRRYLADLQAIWEKSPALRPPPARPVDVESALQKVKTRLGAGGKIRPLTARVTYLWKAAAAVALVVATTYFLWLRNTPDSAAVIAAADAALTETLTDGSVVTLSPQSGLAFASGFNTRERRLRLRGAAFFEVKSDAARPFIVEVEELEVRVVGTAFKVDDSTDSASVTVTVTEGKVRVSARGQSLLLPAGEAALYEKKMGLLSRVAAQQSPASNRVLRFDATPLREVVKQIEQEYGVKIILKNKALEECPLTARYNNEPPERVLSLIAKSFSLRLTRTEKGDFMLDGEGCGE